MNIVEAHNRDNLIVMYENDMFMLARLKCEIPKDTFTTEWYALYRQKPFMLGAWCSGGKSLQDFKNKSKRFNLELDKFRNIKKENGNDACSSVDLFLNEMSPDFILFFEWIETLV